MDCLYEHASATITELDDRALFLSVGGDVREEDVAPFFDALHEIVVQRRPARILVDATYFGETSLALRWRIVRQLRDFRPLVERTAIYGLSPKLEALLWLAFTLARRTDIRTFLWRHEAENWVLDPARGCTPDSPAGISRSRRSRALSSYPRGSGRRASRP